MGSSRKLFDCVVIGMGPAGIAILRRLDRMGFSNFVALEKESRAGSSFAKMPEEMRLLTPTKFSLIPGLPTRLLHNAEYPSVQHYARYLEHAPDSFTLNRQIRFSEKVVDIKKEDGGIFIVQTETRTYKTRSVILATGQFSHPIMPDAAGLKNATIPMIHASQYKNVSSVWGMRVLVVGAGNTGGEIALELALAGKKVWLSSRGKPRIISEKFFGLDFHYYLALLEYTARALNFFGARSAYGKTPLVDRGIRDAIRKGRIRLLPGLTAWNGFTGKFEGGISQNFDSVVCATGYTHFPPWLTQLSISEDDIVRGKSKTVPGLFFVGFPDMYGPDSAFIRGIVRDAWLTGWKIKKYLLKK